MEKWLIALIAKLLGLLADAYFWNDIATVKKILQDNIVTTTVTETVSLRHSVTTIKSLNIYMRNGNLRFFQKREVEVL